MQGRNIADIGERVDNNPDLEWSRIICHDNSGIHHVLLVDFYQFSSKDGRLSSRSRCPSFDNKSSIQINAVKNSKLIVVTSLQNFDEELNGCLQSPSCLRYYSIDHQELRIQFY
jgi:hypothetical protein